MKFSVIYLFTYLGRYLEDSPCRCCQLKIIIKKFFVGCSNTPGYQRRVNESEKANVIIAIVFINYFASGKQKSDRYWPASDEEIKEGDIFIKKTSEETKRDWVLRDFLLTKVRI